MLNDERFPLEAGEEQVMLLIRFRTIDKAVEMIVEHLMKSWEIS